MQKNGFVVMAAVALGAALTRTPLVAGAEGTGQEVRGEAPGRSQPAAGMARHGADIEWLGRELKLTDAQKAQLYALDQNLEQQANDIRQNSLLSPPDREAQMKALVEGLLTRIKAVLTSDQIQKFDQMGGMKAVILGPGPLGGIQGAGAGMEVLERELKLTDAQKQQLSSLHRELEQQANDIRQNGLLSPSDREAQMKALVEGLETRIKAVLTSDQIQKFDQMGGMKAVMHHAAVPAQIMIMKENALDWLGLTDAQKAVVEGIMAQDKSAFVAAGGDVTKLRLLKAATWQRITAVLTPEQRQKLAEAERFALEKGPAGRAPEGDEPNGK